ncbi:MAG: prepilin-type N-terminal cleavage/methylation domain-containing protein [Oscillospiraceae bacterium]|nr:prepilin-type N-terminal cleavage/methylation domain-containing protein [Oscillospiraceae bacterium]
MKKSPQKSFKGMTLVEVVVAMGVVVVVAAMLICAVESAIINMRTANKVSDKTANQAAYAANRTDGVTDGTMNIQLEYNATTGRVNAEKYHVTEPPVSGPPLYNGADVGDHKYFEYITVTTAATT